MNGFILLAVWIGIATILVLMGRRFDNEVLTGTGLTMLLLTACVNDIN